MQRETTSGAANEASIEVTERDAIAGVRPRAVVAPASLDECAAWMAEAARDKLRLGFVGGGTALELGAPPAGLDAVVRTERMARIIEHAPADQVVLVEAGVALGALQASLAAHGQRLALDPPAADRATIGGLVATAGFGPLRARYGAVRDLIIGVTLVLADGTVARGGGKVVKNVAGFDLPKIACGSLGTLGLIAAAAFRLHPLPEVVQTVQVSGLRPEQVVALLGAARDAQLEPTCAVAVTAAGAPGTPGRFDLGVRFEGFGKGLAQQVARLAELARAAGAPAEPLSDDAAAAFWRRHDAVRTAVPLRIRVAAPPAQFPAVAAQLAGLGPLAWYALLGVGFAGGEVDPAAAGPAITAARAALVAGGGSLVIERAPAGLGIEPWGPPPPAFAIMQRLKRRFDPDGRLNPGRFVGGL
ncbi:MAG TPA: FAD-binding oxidoreductase [Kofleriaceae bacterium]|jgi:glycolate oxidase FAD binding subunit|nr:FAD-binding oxidoreductase [Kofleriaceae bacterium]